MKILPVNLPPFFFGAGNQTQELTMVGSALQLSYTPSPNHFFFKATILEFVLNY
jgi:hypothetical protein